LSQSDVVTATITIAAAPAVVFPYFTDPALLVQWIGDTAQLAAEPGGLFALDMGDTRVRGTFIEVDPPSRVVFTWGVVDSDSLPVGSTTVEVVLRPDGEQTIVELTHRDLPVDWRERHSEGWTRNLNVLALAAGA
jgi:uncharacterized protein YndB with AHSA1/START domain